MSSKLCPAIALTPGEPAGIGPDIAIALARQEIPAALICIASPTILRDRAAALGEDVEIVEIASPSRAARHIPGQLAVLPVQARNKVIPGHTDKHNAKYVLACLERAVTGCRRGTFDALVTGPINKAVINAAGIPFTGHTEYLALKSETNLPVMMLVAGDLRVALVTTHIPLRLVSKSITVERVIRVVEIVHDALRKYFGIRDPQITVCGLNPHAGEDGYLGDEEIRVITPALEQLRGAGLVVTGPMPADTAFIPPALSGCHAVVTMYHDQGLPVLKAVGFGRAVNVTLGLPFVRVSVDHGTALELAATGRAEAGSIRVALDLAIELARRPRPKV